MADQLDTLGKRVRHARKEFDLDRKPVAKAAGMAYSTLADIENGNSTTCTKIAMLAEALGVSAAWLETGKGEIEPAGANQVKEPRPHYHSPPHEPGPDYVAVERVLLKLSAGITGYQVEHIHGNGPPIFFRQDFIKSHRWDADKLYALKVSGASMEPALYEGDLVVINSAEIEPKDGDVFAVNYEGEMVIKRLKRDAGDWWLMSDNADQRRYAPKRCTEDAFMIGRVVYRQTERI